MISSSIYNLRKKYISNSNDKKDESDSKSKVYTFNQNNLYERDFLVEKSHHHQNRSIQQTYKRKFAIQTQTDKHSKLNDRRNQENRQSSPSQLNRYLKEYQYNYYKLQESQPPKINNEKNKIQDCFSSDKKLGIKQRQRDYDSRQINTFGLGSRVSSNILNRSLSNQRSAIKENSLNGFTFEKVLRNQSQQVPSKTLTFNDMAPQSKQEPLCSKEQLSLIKMLRLQIQQLKQQIQNKNVYISALETKLETHLIERIQVEKILEKNTIFLQQKINALELQNKKIVQKLTLFQNQSTFWNKLGQKIHLLFSSFQPASSKRLFQPNNIDIQQYLDPVVRSLTELDTYKKLIQKIYEMKQKIQNSENFHSSQQFKLYQKATDQQICLKNLWKWLKTVGKQYQIIKKRVLTFENENAFLIN